jgi:hypothetical protein
MLFIITSSYPLFSSSNFSSAITDVTAGTKETRNGSLLEF